MLVLSWLWHWIAILSGVYIAVGVILGSAVGLLLISRRKLTNVNLPNQFNGSASSEQQALPFGLFETITGAMGPVMTDIDASLGVRKGSGYKNNSEVAVMRNLLIKDIGAELPKTCSCSCQCTGSPSSAALSPGTSSNVSLTEGNLTERVPISKIGTTLRLDAVYNSYNADGSRATVDTC